jgi:hypothetical protein
VKSGEVAPAGTSAVGEGAAVAGLSMPRRFKKDLWTALRESDSADIPVGPDAELPGAAGAPSTAENGDDRDRKEKLPRPAEPKNMSLLLPPLAVPEPDESGSDRDPNITRKFSRYEEL